MQENTRKNGSRWAQVIVVLLLAAAFGLMGMAMLGIWPRHRGSGGSIMAALNNCRNIIQAIKLYASDEDGRYPDSAVPSAKDSNTVFRQLFKAEKADYEKMYGCAVSRFKPDGDLGSPPEFAHALQPNENHWAMTKGLNDNSPENIPLVYETPAESTWPPKWNPDVAGRLLKGRTWSGGRIIIGLNDSSVEIMKLSSRTGTRVPLAPVKPSSENLFELARKTPEGAKYEVLDIAVEEEP